MTQRTFFCTKSYYFPLTNGKIVYPFFPCKSYFGPGVFLWTHHCLLGADSRIRQCVWEGSHQLCLIGIVSVHVVHRHPQSQVLPLVVQVEHGDVVLAAGDTNMDAELGGDKQARAKFSNITLILSNCCGKPYFLATALLSQPRKHTCS